MTLDEIALANEVCDELVSDIHTCCDEAKRRLSGQLLNEHVANAALIVLFEALIGYSSAARTVMIDHITEELMRIRTQP